MRIAEAGAKKLYTDEKVKDNEGKYKYIFALQAGVTVDQHSSHIEAYNII